MQHLRLRGRAPPIIFTRIVRPMNALQLCPWQFSHSCYGWGTTSENRSKIGDVDVDGWTDGRTEFSSQYRGCITCSAVKIRKISESIYDNIFFNLTYL